MSASNLSQTFHRIRWATFGKYFLLERMARADGRGLPRGGGGPGELPENLGIKRSPHLSQDASFVQMFIDEARSAPPAHPNWCRSSSSARARGVLHRDGYVHGGPAATQKKRVKVGLTVPVAAVTEIGRQLWRGARIRALTALVRWQAAGDVHRDITPSNLMLSFHGAVKSLDFWGSPASPTSCDTATRKSEPSQGKLSTCRRADPGASRRPAVRIFSLGVVLHDCSRPPPVKGDSDLNVSRMIVDLPIRKPSLNNAAVPPGLDEVVMRALDRDVNARYATAGQMASDLDLGHAGRQDVPREHVKLLHDLFPGEVSAVTETGFVSLQRLTLPSLPGPRDPAREREHEQLSGAVLDRNSRPGSAQPTSGVLTSNLSGLSRLGRAAYRKRMARGARGPALATVVFVVRHATTPRRPGRSHGVAATPTAVARASEDADTVRCSLDSTPRTPPSFAKIREAARRTP